jgi:hypothetical protein
MATYAYTYIYIYIYGTVLFLNFIRMSEGGLGPGRPGNSRCRAHLLGVFKGRKFSFCFSARIRAKICKESSPKFGCCLRLNGPICKSFPLNGTQIRLSTVKLYMDYILTK